MYSIFRGVNKLPYLNAHFFIIYIFIFIYGIVRCYSLESHQMVAINSLYLNSFQTFYINILSLE